MMLPGQNRNPSCSAVAAVSASVSRINRRNVCGMEINGMSFLVNYTTTGGRA